MADDTEGAPKAYRDRLYFWTPDGGIIMGHCAPEDGESIKAWVARDYPGSTLHWATVKQEVPKDA
jgi:hypothetical protein